MGVLEVVEIVLTAIIGAVVSWTASSLVKFRAEQQEANRANALANRSMQRDVLYRYFHIIVEEGKAITPEEWAHVEECYNAYHVNGGNGTGTLMFEKMKACVKLDTGRG